MGLEDAAESVAVAEQKPASALLDEPVARGMEATNEPPVIVGHMSDSAEPKLTLDGNSALGSFSEAPELSGAFGSAPTTQDQGAVDPRVRLIRSSIRGYTDFEKTQDFDEIDSAFGGDDTQSLFVP